ncbi:MAG TPA: HD domain-containing phosphohydrolase [Dehalococcoidia bacterium]
MGAYLATDIVTGSLEERFANQLAEAGRVTADAVVEKERDHLESVRAISFSEGVDGAIVAGDETVLRNIVQPIAANNGVERLEVLDAQGQRILAEELVGAWSLDYAEIDDADEPGTWPVVSRVLSGETDESGDKFAQVVQTEGGFVFYTAGPVYEADSVVGVVLIGTTLETFVADVKTSADADITIYDIDGAAVASTFALASGTLASEAQLNPSATALTETLTGATLRENRDLFGRGYDLVYGRLRVRDQIVGLYSVALPTDFIVDAGASTRIQVMILFGIGMALVIGTGFYITHRLTSPILRLVTTASRVSAGDLTVRSGVKSRDEIGVLATTFDQMTDRLQRQHLSTIRALTSAIDARDPFTSGHSLRVGQLAIMLGKELGLSERVLAQLEIGGYLYDIGKIGIRDSILLKPGTLTDEERCDIEEHPRIGLSILDPVELPEEVLQFVGSHHERIDGSGYPHGLKQDEVSIVMRIAAVADMYDALTSNRPYRDPRPPREVVRFLRSQAPRYLDLDVVISLDDILDEWEERRRTEPAMRGFKLPEFRAEKVSN